MCGRFAITLPDESMAQLFDATLANDLPDIPNYNVCPTTQIHVVTGGDTRHLLPMRWGFIPVWYKKPNGGPLLINARSETIAEKPAFKKAVRETRCLIPCSGFYEWTRLEDGTKLPWYIYRRDGEPMVFAAVWREWEADGDVIRTCAMVTTAATGPMAEIHHRTPVILEPENWALWLGEEGHGAATLMQAPADDVINFHRVDPAVNSNRASGPELIEDIE